jgi:type II secretory ATPase GspE/PulE/Tfp pilus assembly ATPase PilB-like protein
VPAPPRVNSRTITAILIEAGVVTAEQVEAGLALQRQTGRRIGESLVELGAVSEEDIGWALGHQLALPFVDVQIEALDRGLIHSFPEGLLHRLDVVPLLREEGSLSIALSDPTDSDVIDTIERAAGCTVNLSVATPTAIRTALHEVLGAPREPLGRVAPREASPRFDVQWDRSGASFLLFHLSKALKAGASEIHFLPGPGELRVSYRVRRALVEAGVEPFELTYALLSRLSALGGPSIDQRDVHVTGQVVCPHGDQDLLLDVSLLNHDHGVAVTLGLDVGSSRPPSLEDLGLAPLEQARIRAALDQPTGLVLVTGPARAGCSTTLASLLAATPLADRRVLIFESRSGPRMPAGIRLTLPPKRARAAWPDIALAQNADIVVLSDVLQNEAIEGALCSAGSGRLVIASTDWLDTFSLVDFLLARPHLRPALASRLHLVVQQRLLYDAPGAESATGPFIAGRRVLFEVLHITDGMRSVLRDGDPARHLSALAASDGFRPLVDQVRQLEASGTLEAREVARVMA